MFFCPSLDLSDVGYSGDESEQDKGEHAVIGMGHALLGTRIGQGGDDSGESVKGRCGRNGSGHGKPPC